MVGQHTTENCFENGFHQPNQENDLSTTARWMAIPGSMKLVVSVKSAPEAEVFVVCLFQNEAGIFILGYALSAPKQGI